jgi:2-dehydro-3-deoxyglucarate aldolase/4-hydroxy-2-oxoheptanedioate aldolase
VKPNEPLRRIRRGDVALGMFALEFPSTGLARTAASAGAEFIVFDQEHTGWTTDTIRQLLASARPFEIAPLVRVPTSEPHGISIALALGALGVMVPMVDTPNEAKEIVAAAKYPPPGSVDSLSSTSTSTRETSRATCGAPTRRSRWSS